MPAGVLQNLPEQVLRRADPVLVVKGEIEILFVELRTDMLAGNCRRHAQSLVRALRRAEQEPVVLAVPRQADEITAPDVVPAEVARAVHRLRQCEALFLPAGDFRG